MMLKFSRATGITNMGQINYYFYSVSIAITYFWQEIKKISDLRLAYYNYTCNY